MTPEIAAAITRDALGILTDRELATALEVEPETLAVWRSQKKGPAHAKLGKQIFYRLADVKAWVERRVVLSDA